MYKKQTQDLCLIVRFIGIIPPLWCSHSLKKGYSFGINPGHTIGAQLLLKLEVSLVISDMKLIEKPKAAGGATVVEITLTMWLPGSKLAVARRSCKVLTDK